MSAHNTSELCAPWTWVTMPEDEKNEILVLTQVQKPSSDDIFDMFKEFMSTTTDERILQLHRQGFIEHGSGSYIAYLMARSPWEVNCDCEGFYLLYKQWYDTVSTNMGVKPQVTIHSPMKYNGMPEHWIYKCTLNTPIIIDDGPDAPIPMDPDVQILRRSSRARNGVEKLTYGSHGQFELNTIFNHITNYNESI